MHLAHELELAKQLARQAGIIARNRQHDVKVSYKPFDQGPVSDVDIALDDLICHQLQHAFPGDQVIGEESYHEQAIRTHGRVWLVDPIDGTSAYVSGGDDFVVMIGLMIAAKPVLGVIYHPSSDRLWYGIDFMHERFCARESGGQISPLVIPHGFIESPRVAISKTSKSKRQALFLQYLQPTTVIKKNSIGLKAMLVLEQQADLYVCFSRHMKLWDTCAAVAIIEAAGSMVMHCDSAQLEFDRGISHGNYLMVSNYQPNKELLDLLRDVLYC